MRKLAMTLAVTAAVLGAGFLAWKAEATTNIATATMGAMAKTYSPIRKAACHGRGRHCPAGYHWVCGPAYDGQKPPYGCWCAPC
jgi:hypothetical protein